MLNLLIKKKKKKLVRNNVKIGKTAKLAVSVAYKEKKNSL